MRTQNGCLNPGDRPIFGGLQKRSILSRFFVFVLPYFALSSDAYGRLYGAAVEVESALWSRIVTTQGSYHSTGNGLRLGGDFFFRYNSHNWCVGGRAHLENVTYRIDSTERQGLGMGIGGGGSWIHRIQENLTTHLLLHFEPWRQMAVGSKEQASINSNRIERSSVVLYSNGFGFESGVGLYKGFEILFKKQAYPILVGLGMNYRLIYYGRIRTKTLNSLDSEPKTVTQKVPTEYHSLVGGLMLQVLIP